MTVMDDDRRIGTHYLALLRANWVLVALVMSVGVASAVFYSHIAPKRYDAKANLLINPIGGSSEDAFLGISIIRESASDPNRSVITAARFVKTPQVGEAVRSELAAKGVRLSTSKLLASVQAQPVPQANIVAISAKSRSPGRAATAPGCSISTAQNSAITCR